MKKSLMGVGKSFHFALPLLRILNGIAPRPTIYIKITGFGTIRMVRYLQVFRRTVRVTKFEWIISDIIEGEKDTLKRICIIDLY